MASQPTKSLIYAELKHGVFRATDRSGDPNCLERKIAFGCTMKVITSYLVVKIFDELRIPLEEPLEALGKRLGMPSLSAYGGASVIDCLSYSLGKVPNIFSATEEREFLDRFAKTEQLFEPGRTFLYGSCGHLLIAVVLEKLTGKKYIDLLFLELFTPLGIEEVTFRGDTVTAKDLPAAMTAKGSTVFGLPVNGDIRVSVRDYLRVLDYFLEKRRQNQVPAFFRACHKVESHTLFEYTGTGWLMLSSSRLGSISSYHGSHLLPILDIENEKAIVLWSETYPAFELLKEVYESNEGRPLFHKHPHEVVDLPKCVGEYKAGNNSLILKNGGEDFEFDYRVDDVSQLSGRIRAQNQRYLPYSNNNVRYQMQFAFITCGSGDIEYIRFDKTLLKKTSGSAAFAS